MSQEAPDTPLDIVRRVLAGHGRAGADVRPLGDGLDNLAFLADGDLVVRLAREPGTVLREAALLAALPAALPVPRPVLVVPALGCLAYPLLPGTPLLGLAEPPDPAAVGGELGRLMAALRTVEADVEEDLHPPAAWLEGLTAEHVPTTVRPRVEAFLAAPPPEPAGERVLCHDDLGAEHVLVDPATGRVTGVLDWTDAALTDPAHDLGRILRDLGTAGLSAALAAYGRPVDPDRILFHARCAALEDLAYGTDTGRSAYTGAALAALPRLFPARPFSG